MSTLTAIQSDPLAYLINLLYRLPAVLIALTLHEVAHGYVALKCGDDTAQLQGRLSLNPLHHLSLTGILCMLVFHIGWAKPVPVNPQNFKHPSRDNIFVSLAGIIVNLCLFIISAFFYVFCLTLLFQKSALQFQGFGSYFSLLDQSGFYLIYSGEIMDYVEYLAGFGLNIESSMMWISYLMRFLANFMLVNLSLAIFNFMPIPPLDGYRFIDGLLLKGKTFITQNQMMIILAVFLAINYATGFFSNILYSGMVFVQKSFFNLILPILGLS